MSNKLRNPFKLRNSEKIESEIGFLRLFSPLVLEALANKYKSGNLWENVLLIHSSPGGGKTSLLRVFEPASLTTLLNSKSAPDYKSLFNSLKKIEVIDKKVEVLGVSIPCTRNYQILEELDISDAQKKRLFFSLLNSRITLATLRAACKLCAQKFPEGLRNFQFNYDNNDNYFRYIDMPCNGQQLFDWASNIEKNIYRTIDSFIPSDNIVVEGHDELISLLVLRPENLLLKGKGICSRILFMFDDAHKLSNIQRALFKQYIFEKRSDVNVWIAERLEALKPQDQLGSFEGRDFEVLNLENFWKNNPSKLVKILRNISDKRAAISTEEVISFQEYLGDHLNEEEVKDKLVKIIEETWGELQKISQYTSKFDYWIEHLHNTSDEESLLDRAKSLTMAKILVNRNLGKTQLSFEFPMSLEELSNKTNADVRNAADLFYSINNDIPYYYSFDVLAKLSSFNIEQFLAFSSELFEEMISHKIKGDDIMLSDSIQHAIINKVSIKNWQKLSTEIPNGQNIQIFLKALGDFSKKQTFKPNAPYAPGVNGFAIKSKTQASLYKEEIWLNNPIYEPLINVISTCVAFNLLVRAQVSQGQKGQTWTIYYLNRWLCVLFGLPLSYGGWRHQTPDQLSKWIKK